MPVTASVCHGVGWCGRIYSPMSLHLKSLAALHSAPGTPLLHTRPLIACLPVRGLGVCTWAAPMHSRVWPKSWTTKKWSEWSLGRAVVPSSWLILPPRSHICPSQAFALVQHIAKRSRLWSPLFMPTVQTLLQPGATASQTHFPMVLLPTHALTHRAFTYPRSYLPVLLLTRSLIHPRSYSPALSHHPCAETRTAPNRVPNPACR